MKIYGTIVFCSYFDEMALSLWQNGAIEPLLQHDLKMKMKTFSIFVYKNSIFSRI